MSDPVPDCRVNRKKLENLQRIKKKQEAKISKNKQKKLAQIAHTKQNKQTRESLFEKLQLCQLDKECMEMLASISGRKRPVDEKKEAQPAHVPKKLRCVSANQLKQNVVERQQRNHIETDSSSSDEENECSQTVQNGQEPEIQILEDNVHPNRTNDAKELKLDKPQQIIEKIHLERAEVIKNSEKRKKKSRHEEEKAFYEVLARIKGQHIFVQRQEEVECQRMKLPINAEEQPIVEAINENPVVIVCGETGSGKTTQVPQFLYEAGYTSNGHLIGVTEPRRIAAISMAARVGEELGNKELASYQIRYEGNRTDQTKILFMTDGVLLKELQSDCTLSRFSVIVIDEAHERSIYSDVLIGLLSRICVARLKKKYPLKLVIMSATLRLNDFLQERLFPNLQPKVLSVESRQFPVSIYFERRTPENYLEAAFKKVCKIHEQYPLGGILVFLSGQNEVHHLIKLLEQRYPAHKPNDVDEQQKKRHKEKESKRAAKKKGKGQPKSGIMEDKADELVLDYDEFGIYDMDGGDERNFFMEKNEDEEAIESSDRFPPLRCLPLYSLLPGHLQKRIFEPVPDEDGSRICVISTNVAETSLTIPNIRYVVDSGKEKRRDYDPITGVSRFVIDWCSKASADQRSGRAGRVQSGYTFRLYSSAVYEDMPKYSNPEILNKPIEQLVLFLKSMGFAKLANFPFPTPPKQDQIAAAESRLLKLGALSPPKDRLSSTQITPLGCTLVQIPLAPSFAKVLVSSFSQGMLPYAITLVSALSVREPLIPVSAIREATVERTQDRMAEMLKQRRLWCTIGEARLFGDLTVLLNVIGAADYELKKDHKTLCSLGLRPKALDEVNKLRCQLVNILNTSESLKEKLPTTFKMEPPSQEHLRKLRRVLVDCFPEKIAKKVDEADAPKGAYKTQMLKEHVFIDSSSMLFKEQPDFVVYQEIVQTAEKKVLQNVAVVELEWIPAFVKNFFENKL